jgi:hypothetical protein
MHKKGNSNYNMSSALEKQIRSMDTIPVKHDKSFVQSLPNTINNKGNGKRQEKAFKSLFKKINKQMDEVM